MTPETAFSLIRDVGAPWTFAFALLWILYRGLAELRKEVRGLRHDIHELLIRLAATPGLKSAGL